MKDLGVVDFIHSPVLTGVVDTIVGLLSPQVIYLYNQRVNTRQITTSFKLCVVADTADKLAAERDIYLESDCDVPFDILLYTPTEWRDLTGREGSFAGRILETGTVVYHG